MAGKTTRKRPAATAPDESRPENDVPTRVTLETLNAWKRLVKKNKGGKAPTTRALAAELGVSQRAAVWRLQHAHAKGLLQRKPVTVLGPYELSKEGERWLEIAG